MLETSTNGAGAEAAVEAAAAGREDQRGVAGLGFGAGGRAAPEGVPDPELVEQAKRRSFTAEYKAKILARADACTRPGEVGELLRAEGLYTSHLTYWRKQRKDGALRELGEAIALYEQNLADRARVLGPDHPDTLMSRSNLAFACRAGGRLDEAILLYDQTLVDRVRVLGSDHPGTLVSRNNVAFAYLAAGRLVEAVALLEENLADRLRVLGPDHPQTLTSRSNLGIAYEATGRLDDAIALYERALADRARVLGEDHPDTAESRNYLASAYESARRLGDPGSVNMR